MKRYVNGEYVDMTPDEIAQLEAARASLPVGPVIVHKSPLFRRMTDEEYDLYLQIRATFPPRLQAIFDAAEYLSSDDEFWPDLVAAAEQAYGAERAAELLAPTA